MFPNTQKNILEKKKRNLCQNTYEIEWKYIENYVAKLHKMCDKIHRNTYV